MLGKAGIKLVFEYDKVVLTKNNLFVRKGYFNNDLFHLNVFEAVINNNASGFAYVVECDDMWHVRLGHVNYSYIKQMHAPGTIKDIKITNPKKCEICVEVEAIKRYYKTVEYRE